MPPNPTFGKMIFLNGPSSSGKSTLAKELQRILPEPFLHFSFDHFRDANMLPMERFRSGEFDWKDWRERVFRAYHECLFAMLSSGCNVVAEHIIETEEWCARLSELSAGADVFLVALRCDLKELERRERARGDRRIGEAAADVAVCYSFCRHDFEVNSAKPASENAARIVEAWSARDLHSLSRFSKDA